MNFKKIPIVACPLNLTSILLPKKNAGILLKNSWNDIFDTPNVYFANSATTAFYLYLQAVKSKNQKNEVIIPAYTAASVVNAIRKAGLKPVLCDISLDDFNMDTALLNKTVNLNTLAVVVTHMFGIVAKNVSELKQRFPEVMIIEDCAQAFGSKLNGKLTGNFSDAGFFSFNRGKNTPSYGGGVLIVKAGNITAELNRIFRELPVTRVNPNLIVKLLALYLAVKPCVYGILHFLISRFKDIAPSEDFEVSGYTDLQASVELALMRRFKDLSCKRYSNGKKIIESCKNLPNLVFPQINENTMPAFNRLPVIVKDLSLRGQIEKKLRQAGFETSRMYLKPLHRMFDLGYAPDLFPKAAYLAEHLLTLPCHPLLSMADRQKIIEVLESIC